MIFYIGQYLKIGKSVFEVAENKPKLEFVILRHRKSGKLLSISYELLEILMTEKGEEP